MIQLLFSTILRQILKNIPGVLLLGIHLEPKFSMFGVLLSHY